MKLSFTPLPHDYAIIRQPHDAPVPDWIGDDGLTSITRADDEFADVVAEHGWAALRVDMLAALDEPGVVMSAITPISSADLGVFVISTHLRDYILVQRSDLTHAFDALIHAGHEISKSD